MSMFDNSEIVEFNIMTPALRIEGCKFVSMKKLVEEKNGTSNTSCEFLFEKADNKSQIKLREFEPKKNDTESDEDFKKRLRLTTSRIGHIARAYLTEEEFKAIKGDNFSGYIKATAIALGATDGKKVDRAVPIDATGKTALKVTYNYNKKDNKWYAGFPAVPDFISTSNHPKEFKKTSYDNFEIPSSRPDTEKGTTNQTSQQAPSGQSFGGGAITEEPGGGF